MTFAHAMLFDVVILLFYIRITTRSFGHMVQLSWSIWFASWRSYISVDVAGITSEILRNKTVISNIYVDELWEFERRWNINNHQNDPIHHHFNTTGHFNYIKQVTTFATLPDDTKVALQIRLEFERHWTFKMRTSLPHSVNTLANPTATVAPAWQ